MGVLVGQGRPGRGQGRDVRRQDVADLLLIVRPGPVEGRRQHRLPVDVAGLEPVAQVQLAGRARLDADLGAGQFGGALQVKIPGRQEALTVVVADPGEIDALAGVAAEGPAGVARQQVHLAGLQGGEALVVGQGDEGDPLRTAQHRGGQGAAEVDVEAGPAAGPVLVGESGQPRIDAAAQDPSRLDRRQGPAGRSGRTCPIDHRNPVRRGGNGRLALARRRRKGEQEDEK
jgi:hypothetical protein